MCVRSGSLLKGPLIDVILFQNVRTAATRGYSLVGNFVAGGASGGIGASRGNTDSSSDCTKDFYGRTRSHILMMGVCIRWYEMMEDRCACENSLVCSGPRSAMPSKRRAQPWSSCVPVALIPALDTYEMRPQGALY